MIISIFSVILHEREIRKEVIDEKDYILNKKTIERIDKVIGATNHSFLLRNSEHLVSYVLSGSWYSCQFENKTEREKFLRSEEKQKKYYQNYLKYDNLFPGELQEKRDKEKRHETIFEEDKDNLIFEGAFSKDAANAFNILVLGKTGAGKSHIINLLYNQIVCEEASGDSHSKTRDIEITHSKPKHIKRNEKNVEEKTVNIADTIGICDDYHDNIKVRSMINLKIKPIYKYISKGRCQTR